MQQKHVSNLRGQKYDKHKETFQIKFIEREHLHINTAW